MSNNSNNNNRHSYPHLHLHQQLQQQQQQQQYSPSLSSSPSTALTRSNNNHNNNLNNNNNNNNSSGANNNNNNNNASSEQYLQKFANSHPNSKKTFHFRNLYVQWCSVLGRAPTQELVRNLKNTIRAQTPFQRLSICHAGIDDEHVKALVNTLLGLSPPSSPSHHMNNGRNNGNGGSGDSVGTDVPSSSSSSSSPSSSPPLLSSSSAVAAEPFDVNEILLNHNEITDDGCVMMCDHVLNNEIWNAKITSVELFGNKLGDGSCEALSHMLQSNVNLKRLKLGDNNIGPVGATILSEGLKKNSTLTQLHLGGNSIQVNGLKAISEALMGNVALTSLGLRDNNVGPEGIKYLADTLAMETCALSDIQLKGNAIGPQGAAYLASALCKNKSLKVLELQSNNIGPFGVRVVCSALKENTSVHALNFNDNDLSDEGSEAVALLLEENPSITTLGLANNRIRKKGASSLARALECSRTAITGLDLGSNEINNSGAVALANALKSNVVLTSLDLRSCEIHLKGILALADMARVNQTLRHLDLGANYAKNHGAIAWADVLKSNKSLTRLCLTDNQIYHEGGEALATGLQTNYTLRNFSYGGQGASANRIDSTIRRVIDSIVSENKRHWESIGESCSGSGEAVQENDVASSLVTSYESSNQFRFVSIPQLLNGGQSQYTNSGNNTNTNNNNSNNNGNSGGNNNNGMNNGGLNNNKLSRGAQSANMRSNNMPGMRNSLPASLNTIPLAQQQQGTSNRSNKRNSVNVTQPLTSQQAQVNLPNWFTANMRLQHQVDPALLDARLEILFKNHLLKAENPKFRGHYFIGNVINTLRKVFPDMRIDEVGLVHFAYNNPKYYVHLSREMVKTQIKYQGDVQQPNNFQMQQTQQQLQPQLQQQQQAMSQPQIQIQQQQPQGPMYDVYDNNERTARRRPATVNLGHADGSFFTDPSMLNYLYVQQQQQQQQMQHHLMQQQQQQQQQQQSQLSMSSSPSNFRHSGDLSQQLSGRTMEEYNYFMPQNRLSTDSFNSVNSFNPNRGSGDYSHVFPRSSMDYSTAFSNRASGDITNLSMQADVMGSSPQRNSSPRINDLMSQQQHQQHQQHHPHQQMYRLSGDFTPPILSAPGSLGSTNDYLSPFVGGNNNSNNSNGNSNGNNNGSGGSLSVRNSMEFRGGFDNLIHHNQFQQQQRGSGNFNNIDWSQQYPSEASNNIFGNSNSNNNHHHHHNSVSNNNSSSNGNNNNNNNYARPGGETLADDLGWNGLNQQFSTLSHLRSSGDFSQFQYQ